MFLSRSIVRKLTIEGHVQEVAHSKVEEYRVLQKCPMSCLWQKELTRERNPSSNGICLVPLDFHVMITVDAPDGTCDFAKSVGAPVGFCRPHAVLAHLFQIWLTV